MTEMDAVEELLPGTRSYSGGFAKDAVLFRVLPSVPAFSAVSYTHLDVYKRQASWRDVATGDTGQMRERSRFSRRAGRWVYEYGAND